MESDDKSVHNDSNKYLNLAKRKELRIKFAKLTNKHFIPRCQHFINNMRSLNFRILESSGGAKSIDKEVKESRNFRFGKNKNYFIHFTDLSPFQIEFNPFIKDLRKQFSKAELNIIRKNKDYYIQNNMIKDKLTIFNEKSLYEILNKEEKDEEEKKNTKQENNKKIFHNLNYFNKRRENAFLCLKNKNKSFNSMSTINNSLSKSNKSDKNNLLHFYQTSLNNSRDKNGKSFDIKNHARYKLENISNYHNIMKNKMEEIDKEIRKGVKKRKIEDNKLELKKEERRKIFSYFEKKSQKEIKQFLEEDDDNSNYFNEINWFKKTLKMNKNKNGTETYFPKIKEYHDISKINKLNTFNTNFTSASEKNINFKGNSNINNNGDQKLLHRNKTTIKKSDFTIKKGENEQTLIKEIHRKIRAIYKSLKHHNKE